MENKSIIIGLPIVPFNQSKHSDVCKYLECIQELVKENYGKDDKGSYQVTSKLSQSSNKFKLFKLVQNLCGTKPSDVHRLTSYLLYIIYFYNIL